MRDVSGVTGAAPAWLEIITRLQGAGSTEPLAPPVLAAVNIRYAAGTEPPRREWFIPGTELARVEAAPAASLKPRLESPPDGMIVGLDPDIPADRQHVLFRAAPQRSSLRFQLDGRDLAAADREFFWPPQAGAHILKLLDARGVEQDRIAFSVRGALPGSAASGQP
jgi:penicillin-binding protein 1C